MIDWLRREFAEPRVECGTKSLPIAIRRHPRARRLTMRLSADGREVRITLPQWCGTAHALAFARSRADWLAAELARIPKVKPFTPGGSVPFRGRDLAIDWSEANPRCPRLEGDRLLCGGPAAGLGPRVRRWLQDEALRLCTADLAYYCTHAGEPPATLKLSNAQRRWGSCAVGRDGARVVRINWRLAMAPDEVRRSVVAHEVAHFAHFDHSRRFHDQLARIFEGDIAGADAWLRQHGRALYAVFG